MDRFEIIVVLDLTRRVVLKGSSADLQSSQHRAVFNNERMIWVLFVWSLCLRATIGTNVDATKPAQAHKLQLTHMLTTRVANHDFLDYPKPSEVQRRYGFVVAAAVVDGNAGDRWLEACPVLEIANVRSRVVNGCLWATLQRANVYS